MVPSNFFSKTLFPAPSTKNEVSESALRWNKSLLRKSILVRLWNKDPDILQSVSWSLFGMMVEPEVNCTTHLHCTTLSVKQHSKKQCKFYWKIAGQIHFFLSISLDISLLALMLIWITSVSRTFYTAQKQPSGVVLENTSLWNFGKVST